MKEIWKNINGFNDNYQISNLGRIRSLGNSLSGNSIYKRGRILKFQKDANGYSRVDFCKKHFKVHRLVAQVFIPNPENKPQVNHINGIKHDNRVENLEWVTLNENMKHSVIEGLHVKGEQHGNSKLTWKEVNEIRELYYKGNISQIKLGKMYGVSNHQISIIVRFKQWNH